jgi:YesN/AraC family two-component response regulator
MESSEEMRRASNSREAAGGSMAAKKLAVLLVDDSRTVLAQIEKVVEASDHAEVVGTASNGAEAIQRASELKPDLVIMDIVMPDIDGLAALRMLQAKQPEIRVAMLSSVGGMASKAEEAFRLGAVQVLGKPVDGEILEALLAQECERAQSQQEA